MIKFHFLLRNLSIAVFLIYFLFVNLFVQCLTVYMPKFAAFELFVFDFVLVYEFALDLQWEKLKEDRGEGF